jgi:Periplasmic binding protein
MEDHMNIKATHCHSADVALASPRIPDWAFAAHPHSTKPPAAHTGEEIRTLTAMLRSAGASSITIGHGRHPASRDAALAVIQAWTDGAGTVLGTIDWPERAASWLKPARQLVQTHPDAWVIIDNPAGCAQLAMRLTDHLGWSPARTFGTASMYSPDAAALTGFGVLTGMRGVTPDGATWRIGHGVLLREEPSASR